MEITIKELESHLDYLAHAISTRKDGEMYIPLFERIETEVTKLKTQNSKIDQIRLRAANNRQRKTNR